jgi:hypothetical protein
VGRGSRRTSEPDPGRRRFGGHGAAREGEAEARAGRLALLRSPRRSGGSPGPRTPGVGGEACAVPLPRPGHERPLSVMKGGLQVMSVRVRS